MKIEKPLQHNLAEDVQGSKKVSFIGESCSQHVLAQELQLYIKLLMPDVFTVFLNKDDDDDDDDDDD